MSDPADPHDSAPRATRWGPLALPAAIVALALVVRVVVVVTSRHSFKPVDDEVDYLRLAASIRAGHGWAGIPLLHGGAYALRPPLYPLSLTGLFFVTGTHVTSARLFGAVLGAVSVALIGVLGRQLGGRRAGVVAMAIAAVYPSFVILDTRVYSEPLFIPLYLAAVVVAIRAARTRSTLLAVGAGGLAALSWLVRSNGLIVVVAVAVVLLVGRGWAIRSRAVAAAVALLASALVISPWTIRNYVHFHEFVPVANESGYGLAGTFNPQAENAAAKAQWIPPWELPEFAADFRDPALNEVQLGDRLSAAGKRYAEHHLGYVLDTAGINSGRIFGVLSPHRTRLLSRFYAIDGFGADVWFAGWVVLVVLLLAALPGLVRRGPPDRFMVVLVGMAIAFWVTSLASAAEVRYREPVEAVVVPLVALGLTSFARRRSPTAP